MGGGGGWGDVQKKYSRKGKLNEKKFRARQLTLKKINAKRVLSCGNKSRLKTVLLYST